MSYSEPRDWRSFLIKVGVALFIVSIPLLVATSAFFGYDAIAWPTAVLVYPSLMMIGVAVGFGDFIEVFCLIRDGMIIEAGVLPVLFLLGRGLVFSSVFFSFLWMEIRVVSSLVT